MDKDLKELMYRETYDCTARPIFVVFRKNKQVSPSAAESIDLTLTHLDESFEVWQSYEEPINIKQLVEDEDIESIERYLENAGFKVNNWEDEQIYYWSEEDEIQCDIIERAFWTREEANEWCERNRHNGSYYSYSIMAEGVLAELMNYTCKREIERTKERQERENEQ